MNKEDLHEGMLVAIGNKKLLYTHKALQGIVLQVGGWTARSNFGRKRIENFRQKPSGKMVAIGQRDHNGVWTPEVISLDRILMPWEEYERFMSSNTPCLPPRPSTHKDFDSLTKAFFERFRLPAKDVKIVGTPENARVLLTGNALAKVLKEVKDLDWLLLYSGDGAN